MLISLEGVESPPDGVLKGEALISGLQNKCLKKNRHHPPAKPTPAALLPAESHDTFTRTLVLADVLN